MNYELKHFYILLVIASILVISAVIWSFIGTFVVGLFVYYVSRPIYKKINQYIRYDSISAIISLIVFSLPLVILFSYIILVVLRDFFIVIQDFDQTFEELLDFGNIDIDLINELIDEILITGAFDADVIISTFFDSATLFLILLFHLFLVFVFGFYALRDGITLRKEIEDKIGNNSVLMDLLVHIDRDFKVLFFGNVLYAVTAAIIGAIVFYSLHLISPDSIEIYFPLLVGFVTGLSSIIPLVGMKVIYIPYVVYITVESIFVGPETYWYPILFIVVVFLIVDTIPDFIIRPYVSSDRIHMGLLLFAYALGPFIFGWYGVFLAPILLIIIINIKRIILPELLKTSIVEGDKVQVQKDDMNAKAIVRDVDRISGSVTVKYLSSDEELNISVEKVNYSNVLPDEEIEE